VDADVQEVARGIGLDNRIGPKFLHPGPGYGGSCFPKDTLALLQTAAEAGVEQRIVKTVVEVNDDRKASMVDRVEKALGGDVSGKRVGVLGLAFKPNTDDMREAPSLDIVQALLDAGARVCAYDPQTSDVTREMLPDIAYAASPYEPAKGADCLVLVTEWDAFRSLDFAQLKAVMRVPRFVDLRNVYREAEVKGHGFAYTSVGRPVPAPASLAVAAE